MYQPETILALKEPRSTKDNPFPYDKVKVIGQSPVDHGLSSQRWEGANGQGVIITPLTAFGSTIDEPYGKLQRLYKVEELPEVVVPTAPVVRVKPADQAGPSPEDVFADEAEKQGKEVRTKRQRKRVKSPLDGEERALEPDNSPLGTVDPDSAPDEPDPDRSPLDG